MRACFWSRFTQRPFGYLWTVEAPAASTTTTATEPTAATATTTTATDPKTTTTTPTTTTESPKTFTYQEDRSTWIDPARWKKAEGLINRTAAEVTRLQSAIAERDKRIAALAGVTPPSPEQAEADRIAEAFFALPQFAHLRHVTPELLERVQALVQDGASIQEARDHVWNQHTDRFLAQLDTTFANELGIETLTASQQRKLHAAFGTLIPNERDDPEGYAAFKAKYEAGDASLIETFVKEYVADMLEPARRQAVVPIMQRRPVPRSGPSAAVVTQKPKPDYSKMSIQEMLDHAEQEAASVGR